MDIVAYREYCLSKAGTTEEFPFGGDTLVFKVGGKMYAAAGVELFESITLKCRPELSPELREKYSAVLPGYHMNKKHWNTILMDGTLPDQLIREWIDLSYNLVVEKLPRKKNSKD